MKDKYLTLLHTIKCRTGPQSVTGRARKKMHNSNAFRIISHIKFNINTKFVLKNIYIYIILLIQIFMLLFPVKFQEVKYQLIQTEKTILCTLYATGSFFTKAQKKIDILKKQRYIIDNVIQHRCQCANDWTEETAKTYIAFLLYCRIKREDLCSSLDVFFSFLMPLKCNRTAIVGLFSACNRIFDL